MSGCTTQSYRYVLDFNKGDFESLRSVLSAIHLSSTVADDRNGGDIDTAWQHWKDTFLAALSDYMISKKLKGCNPIPWMNGTIQNINRKKIQSDRS